MSREPGVIREGESGVPMIARYVAEARQRLSEAGIRSHEAELDARLLAQVALGWDAAALIVAAHDPAPPGFAARYDALVARRAAREPLAYIAGRKEFWGLSFEVTPAVLIPRPETEIIVAAAIDLFPPAAELLVADACTGSGCIAVALASERTRARCIATDLSAPALAVARRNAVAHGVADRVRFVQGDLLQPLAGPFDLIVSNPPYVQAGDARSLQPEVRDYEPALALFAGEDGLAVTRQLIAQSAPRLKPGGYLVFEFGLGQDETVESLVENARGLALEGLRRDLQGIARTAIVRRSTDESEM